MSKYNWKKKRKRRCITNPCVEVTLGEPPGSTLRGHNITNYTIDEVANYYRQAEQTIFAAPDVHIVDNQTALTVGPGSAFSDVYRRGVNTGHNTADEFRRIAQLAGDFLDTASVTAPADVQATQGRNQERPYGTSILEGMDFRALRNHRRDADSPFVNTEESSTRS